MISPSFEAPKFFEAIHDKSLPEIQILTQQEVGMAEARSPRVKGAVAAREQGSGDYTALLSARSGRGRAGWPRSTGCVWPTSASRPRG